MKNLLVYVLLLTAITNSVNANSFPKVSKFGKVSLEEMTMKVCAIDTSASAVVIFDQGISDMRYDKALSQFVLETRRHVRIKILTKEALDFGDVELPMYVSGSNRERITNLKAQTYNLENGKITKSKLSRKEIIEEKVSDNRVVAKFTMPKVQEGSVIEYSYILTSPFTYTLETWYFQSSIPTLSSSFQISIPEYYNYSHKLSGYENVKLSRDQASMSILLTQKNKTTYGGNEYSTLSNQTINYRANILKLHATNLPGLRREVYVDNIRNYITKVDFELISRQFPGDKRVDYSNKWENINKDLLEHRNFGQELSGVRFMRKEIEEAITEMKDPAEKMIAVFKHINSTIKWNDRYRLFTDKGIRSAYRDGSGSSSEVNLCLVAALREAGLDAYPIIVSTRTNGLVQPWEVSLAKFNHVIAGVYINNKLHLLDATSNFTVPNIIPLNSINGNGRLIDRNKSVWVDLNPSNISRSVIMGELELDGLGSVAGKFSLVAKDYNALSYHSSLKDDEEFRDYQKHLRSKFNNGEVDSISVSAQFEFEPEYRINYWASIPDSYSEGGDLIYLSPGVGLYRTSNPFVSSERKLPINFHFPFEETMVLKYKIPQGYEVHELPQNKIQRSLEGKAMFVYSISQLGDELLINTRLIIGQTLFTPDNYAALKEFYDIVVGKSGEKIILKKI